MGKYNKSQTHNNLRSSDLYILLPEAFSLATITGLVKFSYYWCHAEISLHGFCTDNFAESRFVLAEY